MNWQPLDWRALNAICEHDRERRGEPRGGMTLSDVFAGVKPSNYVPRFARNITRFYKWLEAEENGDVSVRTVAVKSQKNGMRCAKEVIRASVDSSDVYTIDVAHINMSGYVVDWSLEKLGRKHQWGYGGRWGRETYSRRGKWMIHCETVNAELLDTLERFRYCSWSPACGDILGYLKTYAKNPRVELLAKAGLGHLARLGGFCARLAKNKALMAFVARNREEIAEHYYGADVISAAFKYGITLGAAERRLAEMRVLRGTVLPTCIDRQRAGRYVLDARGCTGWEYGRYIEDSMRLGRDPADTKVAFPRDFHAAQRLVHDQIRVQERKRDSALKRRLARELAKRAAAFAAAERVFGASSVCIPKSDADLEREGKLLHHCVGRMNYAEKMVKGECLIVFVRKASRPNTPFVTVELSPDGGRVCQCYGKHNSQPDQAVKDFVSGKLLKTVAACARKQMKKQKCA